MRTSWTIPTIRLWHGVRFSPAGGSVGAALANGQERGDSLHDHGRHEALGDSTVDASRKLVEGPEDAADAHDDVSAGMWEPLPFWPDPVRTADPDGHDRGARP